MDDLMGHLKKAEEQAKDQLDRVIAARRELEGKPGRKPVPAAKKTKPAAKPKVGRVRRGKRADQALAIVQRKPGVTAAEVAKAMKIKPNYLYRVMKDLEGEGRVVKTGRSYSVAAAD